MSDKKKRKTEEEKIEPFVVPEDWEPTGTVKKMRELVSWIPKELGKKWLEEIRQERRKGRDGLAPRYATGEEKRSENHGMFGRKESQTEEKIEPFVVPEDWEPTDEIVKRMRELVSWIPKELGKKWLEEIREEHRRSK